MNTSADLPKDAVRIERDAVGIEGDDFRIERRPYTDAAVAELVRAVQAEYVVRYGGPDESPMDAAQFDPPAGIFLVGLIGSTPVACGGWRSYDDVGVEIKRMFVVSSARRRGYAARILAELEEYARRAGKTRIRLETGTAQPEAVAMYQRLGYEPVEPFGFYRCAPQSVHLGKTLAGG
jgi:GNAT superfamily N-acetyltransferase